MTQSNILAGMAGVGNLDLHISTHAFAAGTFDSQQQVL